MNREAWVTIALFLHVIVAIAGIGPLFVIPLMERLSGDVAPFQNLRTAITVQRTLAVSLVLQLFTGTALMMAPRFDGILGKQVWLHTSFLLFLIAAGVATGFNLPRTKKALRAAEGGDQVLTARLLSPVEKITGPLVSLLMVLIVLLMVWQPTAS